MSDKKLVPGLGLSPAEQLVLSERNIHKTKLLARISEVVWDKTRTFEEKVKRLEEILEGVES